MGQLSATLGLLEGLADNKDRGAKQGAQKVKQDVFAMGTGTTKGQASDISKNQELATEDLTLFLFVMIFFKLVDC